MLENVYTETIIRFDRKLRKGLFLRASLISVISAILGFLYFSNFEYLPRDSVGMYRILYSFLGFVIVLVLIPTDFGHFVKVYGMFKILKPLKRKIIFDTVVRILCYLFILSPYHLLNHKRMVKEENFVKFKIFAIEVSNELTWKCPKIQTEFEKEIRESKFMRANYAQQIRKLKRTREGQIALNKKTAKGLGLDINYKAPGYESKRVPYCDCLNQEFAKNKNSEFFLNEEIFRHQYNRIKDEFIAACPVSNLLSFID